MRTLLLLALATLTAGCATTAEEEEPLSAVERANALASLTPADREAFELLLWAREVDQQPINARFKACIDQHTANGSKDLPASGLADEALNECFPIVEPLIRGVAMRVPALATGVSGADLNSWADKQASEQREALLADLTKLIEASRANEASK